MKIESCDYKKYFLSPVSYFKGISTRKQSFFKKLGITTVLDLLLYAPTKSDHYPLVQSMQIKNNAYVSVKVTNIQYNTSSNKSCSFYAKCAATGSAINIVFFNKNAKYMVKAKEGIIRGLATIEDRGAMFAVSNEVLRNFPSIQEEADLATCFSQEKKKFIPEVTFVHPEIFGSQDIENGKWSEHKPVYRLTKGIFASDIQKNVTIDTVPELHEWIPDELIKKFKLPSWHEAIIALHKSHSSNEAAARLAMDEAMFICNNNISDKTIEAYGVSQETRDSIVSSAGITLTKSQEKVLSEIDIDLVSNKPMCRLLHGDVGSGKTIVALLSMSSVFTKGKQTALLAPTEVLAQQHYKTIRELLPEGIKIICMTASTKAQNRKLNINDFDIIVGTHSILQEKIIFERLKYIVIDEQHKFGVQQRETLMQKAEGSTAHLLIMSATPIPRTMQRSISGMVDISTIEEAPFKKNVITYVSSMIKFNQVLEYVLDAINNDRQGYWICPAIDDNDLMQSATRRYEFLEQKMGKRVGILHGKLSAKEKLGVMNSFIDGDIKLLVATTAVEIGVDVPNASFITIEDSDRFGLSQLHQLRGRVGRNNNVAHCLLLYESTKLLSDNAINRLNIIKQSNNGFEIAERDLEIRGAGQLYGNTQSGMFTIFDFLDPTKHYEMINEAKRHVNQYRNTDRYQTLHTIMQYIKAHQPSKPSAMYIVNMESQGESNALQA